MPEDAGDKMAGFILIYTTYPDKVTAKKVVKHLLEKRLIACANIFPITSMYWWEGNIQDDKEYVAICKTTEENFENVKKEVESIHSYDVPCIVKIPAEANEKYFNWLKREVSSKKK